MGCSLYLHIPYCQSRCRYCDFYTCGAARAVPDTYVDALLRDWQRYAPKGADGIPLRPDTLYLGGGTPGLLHPAQVARLVQAANPAPGAEVTLETNPEQATLQNLAGWRAGGVNRLSVGVQTAFDDSLRRLGRIHTVAEARTALQNARRAGFANITGDLMLALPGYTTAELDATLALLAGEGVSHISAYLLKIEPNTPFGRKPPADLPDAEQAADFYLDAVEKLAAAGYTQYEISNFAQDGFAGRHNLVYWDCGDYVGLGPAAHSCVGGRRFSFGGDTQAFLADRLPPQPQGEADANDYIMLRLRLAAGLCEETLQSRYGVGLTAQQQAVLRQCAAAGLAHRPKAGVWALTPAGMLVQNSILVALLPM